MARSCILLLSLGLGGCFAITDTGRFEEDRGCDLQLRLREFGPHAAPDATLRHFNRFEVALSRARADGAQTLEALAVFDPLGNATVNLRMPNAVRPRTDPRQGLPAIDFYADFDDVPGLSRGDHAWILEDACATGPEPFLHNTGFQFRTADAPIVSAGVDLEVRFCGPDRIFDLAGGAEVRVRERTSSDDRRTIVDLLVDQVELANVIVLNKCDLVDDERLGFLEGIVHHLNPDARIVRSVRGVVDLSEVMGTGLFDMAKAESMAGWQKELEGEHIPETEAYGIASFVYRARRPFHPERFARWVESPWPNVYRSKGFFWLATRMFHVGSLSQAGAAMQHGHTGWWWSVVPDAWWPSDEATRAKIRADMRGTYGDRRQEIVIIGAGMDEPALRRAFDACLLTDREMALGPKAWGALRDPFPEWPPLPLELQAGVERGARAPAT